MELKPVSNSSNIAAVGRTPLKTENLTFGEALDLLKNGYRVARSGWNGKLTFIFAQTGSLDYGIEGTPLLIDGVPSNLFDKGDIGTITRLPCVNMRTESGATSVGWTPSQTDMLASDWVWLNEPVSE